MDLLRQVSVSLQIKMLRYGSRKSERPILLATDRKRIEIMGLQGKLTDPKVRSVCRSFPLSFGATTGFIVPPTTPKGFQGARGVTTKDSIQLGKYYTDSDIAGLLGISLGRLRNKLSAGQPLPPRIQPPGCRNRLWPSQAVNDWLKQFTITVTDPVQDPISRRRGRPTKEEVRTRRA